MSKIYAFRFMSKEELDKYNNQETISGKRQRGYSDASGKNVVCFMPLTATDINEIADEVSDSYEYLSGVVCDEICAVFVADKQIFEEGYGTYANPYGSFFDTMQVRELMLPLYSCKEMEIIAYSGKPKYSTEEYEYVFNFIEMAVTTHA